MIFRFFVGALVSASVFGAIPATAEVFGSRMKMQVNTMDKGVFELVSSGSAKGYEYWCAAGDYAQRGRGLPWQANIYIARGRGQSQTTGKISAVQFTFDPESAGIVATASYRSSSDLQVGDNMSVQQAVYQCQNISGKN